MKSPRHLNRKALLLLFLTAVLLAGCGGKGPVGQQSPLSQDEIRQRSSDYFNQGMKLYGKGDWRAALDQFRLARAYDPSNVNGQIVEMVEKSEAKLRGTNVVIALGTAVPNQSSGGVPNLAFKTFRSKLYPYSIDLPETWTIEPARAKVAETEADLIRGPKDSQRAPTLTVVAHALPQDADHRRAYVEAHRKLLLAQRMSPDDAGKRLVDGFETTLLRNRGVDSEGKFVETHAIFASDMVGWGLTFTASTEETDRFQPLFHRLLDSFRVFTGGSV